jgi:hypothetical protein
VVCQSAFSFFFLGRFAFYHVQISSSMAFSAVIHDERSAEFFWGDLLSDPVVDIAWTGSADSKKAARLAKANSVRLARRHLVVLTTFTEERNELQF